METYGAHDAKQPSGFEVEVAVFHTPQSGHLLIDHTCDGSMQDKMFHAKTKSRETMTSMKRAVQHAAAGATERIVAIKPIIINRVTALRHDMSDRLDDFSSHLRSHPAKWTGIAAGAGFGLGIVGRIMRNRVTATSVPQIVIIESNC